MMWLLFASAMARSVTDAFAALRTLSAQQASVSVAGMLRLQTPALLMTSTLCK